MTTKIKFNKLSALIYDYPDNIEIIKEHYLDLLTELTETTELDKNLFLENINKINSMGTIIVCYIENPSLCGFKIVASGTIIIEPKIIRGGRNIGHIEDVVVRSGYRGYKISQDILDLLKINVFCVLILVFFSIFIVKKNIRIFDFKKFSYAHFMV